MQDIPQRTLNELTQTELSAQIELWEIDLTVMGGERYFFAIKQMKKGAPSFGKGAPINLIR